MGNQYDDAADWMNRRLKRLQRRVDGYGREVDRRISNVERKFPGGRSSRIEEDLYPLPLPELEGPSLYVPEGEPPWAQLTPRIENPPTADRYLVLKIILGFAVVGGTFALVGKSLSPLSGFVQYGEVLLVASIGASALYAWVTMRRDSIVGLGAEGAGVTSTRPGSIEAPTIIEREVIRVPCQYCGRLVDPMGKCPSCGGDPL